MKRFPRLRIPAIAAVLSLLAIWHAGLAWMADRGIRRVEAASTSSPPNPDPGEAWRGRRFCIDPDSYHWLSFARDWRASPGVRVQRTEADNAPFGRDVHWAQLPIWMLAGLSWALERAGGIPPPRALDLAGRILMPGVGFLFSSSVFWFLARRGRRFAAFLAAVPMAVCTHYNFHALRPDHHGFQIAFVVATWLCLLESGMGWVRADSFRETGDDDLPTHRSARRHFVWAGVFSGLALWLGATVFTVALLATATALALVLSWTRVRDGEAAGAVLCPDAFRAWGVAGAATSLAFYLLEYAPFSFGMRLETNHPLHALCLLGTAEGLRGIARWKQDRSSFGWKDGLPGGAGFAAAAVLPALLVFGPPEWFVPRSTAMLRLHGRFILEFRSLWESGSWGSHFENLPLLLAGGVAGIVVSALGWRRRIPFSRRGPLAFLGIASLAYFLLSCGQVRWVQFLHPCLVLFLAYGWAAACGDPGRPAAGRNRVRWGCALAGLLALAPAAHAAAVQWRAVRELNRVERMSDVWLRAMLQRNVLLELKAALPPGRPLRWMLPVEMAPAAYWFGAGAAVGSLYWENAAGLNAAAEFFGDPLPGARTYEIARERGITHVVVDVERGKGDAYSFYHLLTGRSDYPGVAATVGYALAGDEPLESDWLHLDERLTAVASRPTWIFLPEVGRWTPFRLPLRVYAVDENAFPKEPR